MTQETYKVVQDDPEAARRRRLLIFSLAGLCLLSSYLIGLYDGKRKQAEAEVELKKTSAFLENAEHGLKECRQSLAIATKRSEVDRIATEDIRQQLAQLRNQIARQQEEIAFYQKVMEGQKSAPTLKVEKVELSEGLEPDSYRYQVVLAQVGKKHPWIKGKVNLDLVGLSEGKKRTLSFSALDAASPKQDYPFRFRYFQKLEGELQIPAGFQPEYVQVRLKSEGRTPQVVEGQFPWSDVKGA